MAIECDRYGFFNGIYGLEQVNWANYWRGLIPDGVIALKGNQFEVYRNTVADAGMVISVHTGEAIIDNHHVWNTSVKKLRVNPHTDVNRTDLVVLRVTYGNSGESKVEIDIKQGNPNATVVQNTGGTYEMALAKIAVSSTAQSILPANITDLRYIYRLSNDSVYDFTGATSVSCVNDIEYRTKNQLSTLTINLPANPNDTFITGVDFCSVNSNGGCSVTFKKGTTTITPKLIGDSLSMKNKRYNLVIWWDSGNWDSNNSGNYWCLVKAVAR